MGFIFREPVTVAELSLLGNGAGRSSKKKRGKEEKDIERTAPGPTGPEDLEERSKRQGISEPGLG